MFLLLTFTNDHTTNLKINTTKYNWTYQISDHNMWRGSHRGFIHNALPGAPNIIHLLLCLESSKNYFLLPHTLISFGLSYVHLTLSSATLWKYALFLKNLSMVWTSRLRSQYEYPNAAKCACLVVDNPHSSRFGQLNMTNHCVISVIVHL